MKTRTPKHVGFTLIELLVVIATIAILAGLLLPALSGARSRVLGIACVSNMKQCQIAWSMYLHDNEDRLVRNDPYWTGGGPGNPGNLSSWAGASANYLSPSGVNDAMLMGTNLDSRPVGTLGLYMGSSKVFKCPADRSMSLINSQRIPRKRSCSMNGFMATSAVIRGLGSPVGFFVPIFKVSDIALVGRGDLLVWSDIHEDFIDSCVMNIVFDTTPQDYHYEDTPGSRHNRSCSISFTDGHVELHRWLDPISIPPVTGAHQFVLSTGPSRDWFWLRERMTRSIVDQW